MVFASTGEDLPIWAEGYGTISAYVSIQGLEKLTGADIPEPHCMVFASTGNSDSIRAKYDGEDTIRVAAKCMDESAIHSIPNTDLTGFSSCCQQASIWVECYRWDTSKGIGKKRLDKISLLEIDIVQRCSLQVGLP